jgi:hypothetical protein
MIMRRHRWLAACALALFAVSAGAADGKKSGGTLKVPDSIELTDPAGDVKAIQTSGNDYPGFDVVKVSVKSDGKQITIATTLKNPPGVFASDVLDISFDTDNNAATGAKLFSSDLAGFEYTGQLNACVDYTNGMSACGGGSKSSEPKSHWAAIDLFRFTGRSPSEKDQIVSSMGFRGQKPSATTPITSNVVQGSFDYADLKVKSGQTIRLVLRESGGNDEASGYFPEVLLKLK